jgi:hypothetical protein
MELLDFPLLLHYLIPVTLTTASAAVKRGSFFALAKKMTLFTVGWKRWLGAFYLSMYKTIVTC